MRDQKELGPKVAPDKKGRGGLFGGLKENSKEATERIMSELAHIKRSGDAEKSGYSVHPNRKDVYVWEVRLVRRKLVCVCFLMTLKVWIRRSTGRRYEEDGLRSHHNGIQVALSFLSFY